MREFLVYRDGRLALRIHDTPGTLRSTAPPPPQAGAAPPPPGTATLPPGIHPFIDAQALDAASEGELRSLLDESTSFDDYVQRLAAAGYEVKPATG
jgi:hypothetical protein